MRQTAMAQLVEHKLGRSLAKYVQARHQIEGMGWRRIAQEVHRDTGLVVSHESLRSWFAQDKEAA